MDSLKEVELSQGKIKYRDNGNGKLLLFIHGLLVNGELWRKVVPFLTNNFRCIVPDIPLGSHETPMYQHADLTPKGLANIIAEFIEALELKDVTLIGNDTGGAICQILIADNPKEIESLILTNCDAFDNFLPKHFRYLQYGAHIPKFTFLMSIALRLKFIRNLPIAYGLLTKYPLEQKILDLYVNNIIFNPKIRRDLTKVLKGISISYTIEASKEFSNFKKPVLLVWAPEDMIFPYEYGEKLSKAFPNAEIRKINDSFTFIPEDKPTELAKLIIKFKKK